MENKKNAPQEDRHTAPARPRQQRAGDVELVARFVPREVPNKNRATPSERGSPQGSQSFPLCLKPRAADSKALTHNDVKRNTVYENMEHWYTIER